MSITNKNNNMPESVVKTKQSQYFKELREKGESQLSTMLVCHGIFMCFNGIVLTCKGD